MDTPRLNRLLLSLSILSLSLSVLLPSCMFKGREEERMKKVEKECSKKNEIEGVSVYFLGYPYKEINEIEALIYGTQKHRLTLNVPEKITDSLRHKRRVFIDKKINLKDTVLIILPNKEQYILTDFKYIVRPNFTMFSKDWGCTFYEMKINNIVERGGVATFIKEGFEIGTK